MSPTAPAAASAPSKASYVLQRLRVDIVSGALAPGCKLPFDRLTARYEVGVAPIREALFQLAGYGLVTLESQRGFRVAPMSHADLADVAAMRRHMEIHALGLAIERGGEPWRQRVRAEIGNFIGSAARVGDARAIDEHWQDAHRSFHFALIEACGSSILLEFCSRLYDRFDRYRRTVPSQSHFAATAGDHKTLAELALAGQREKAQALLGRHIEDNAETVIANFAGSAEAAAAM